LSGAQILRLDLRPSRLLAGLIVGAHGAAAACAAVVLPGLPGGLLAAALLCLGLAAAWSRALLRSRSSVRAIEIAPSGVILELAGGERLPARVGARRYVSRLMVTLPVRSPSRRTLLVTPDMLEDALFRRLRLWAIWGKLPPVAGKQLPA
jgi:hypothetical protein